MDFSGKKQHARNLTPKGWVVYGSWGCIQLIFPNALPPRAKVANLSRPSRQSQGDQTAGKSILQTDKP